MGGVGSGQKGRHPATEWKPGESGNAAGRIKGEHTLGYFLRRIAKDWKDIEQLLDPGAKIKNREALARMLWAMALQGDIKAIKEVYDRIDGKVALPLDHGFPGGFPELVVTHAQHPMEQEEKDGRDDKSPDQPAS